MNCDEIRILLPAYQGKTLQAGELKMLKTHLASCAACRNESRVFTDLWDALGALPTIQPSPEFRARFWQRVRDEDVKDSWLTFPRLVPAFAGLLGVWIVGVTLGATLFMRTHDSTVDWSHPSTSISNAYLKYASKDL
jgi:predicted anti-sigma-YlaC factor YlaD